MQISHIYRTHSSLKPIHKMENLSDASSGIWINHKRILPCIDRGGKTKNMHWKSTSKQELTQQITIKENINTSSIKHLHSISSNTLTSFKSIGISKTNKISKTFYLIHAGTNLTSLLKIKPIKIQSTHFSNNSIRSLRNSF